MATKTLSTGAEITDEQITKLRGIFTQTEINDIVSALYDKASGDRAAVAKSLEGTTLEVVAGGVRSLVQTLNAQISRAEHLATAFEACQ